MTVMMTGIVYSNLRWPCYFDYHFRRDVIGIRIHWYYYCQSCLIPLCDHYSSIDLLSRYIVILVVVPINWCHCIDSIILLLTLTVDCCISWLLYCWLNDYCIHCVIPLMMLTDWLFVTIRLMIFRWYSMILTDLVDDIRYDTIVLSILLVFIYWLVIRWLTLLSVIQYWWLHYWYYCIGIGIVDPIFIVVIQWWPNRYYQWWLTYSMTILTYWWPFWWFPVLMIIDIVCPVVMTDYSVLSCILMYWYCQ